jgi:hypothetical protein
MTQLFQTGMGGRLALRGRMLAVLLLALGGGGTLFAGARLGEILLEVERTQASPTSRAYKGAVEALVDAVDRDFSERTGTGPQGFPFVLRCEGVTGWHFDALFPASRVSRPSDLVRLPRGWVHRPPLHRLSYAELRQRVARPGAGVPLVAWAARTPERRERHPFMGSVGFVWGLTAVAEVKRVDGGLEARLLLLDVAKVSEAVLLGQRVTLASDLTAAGEWALRNQPAQVPGLFAMFAPTSLLDRIALESSQPLDTRKIPLVFVHGLQSRPETWRQAALALSGDSRIGEAYHTLFFRYPTGLPVLYSGSELRKWLARLEAAYVRDGRLDVFRKTVVVGHSMGGLITKLQVQSSGDLFMRSAAQKLGGGEGLSPGLAAAIRPMLQFEANPAVARVLFLATPHRGAPLADSFIGRLAIRFISLPAEGFGELRSVLESGSDAEIRRLLDPKMKRSSVINLSASSEFIGEQMSLPLRDGLPYHSIIGNRKGLPLGEPAAGDGVVPYSSAHLDGAVSEKVVRSGHNVQVLPETVDEVARILLLHLKETGGVSP